MKRVLYESNFIFAVLLQIAFERDVRLLPYFSSVGHKLAVAFLAAQKSSPAHSLISRGSIMKMILFLQSYCKLLVGVSLGVHETAYPLGLRWRWRHKDYKDL